MVEKGARNMWIKICGITSPGAARACAEAGADAVGMVFAPGKRRVSLEEARRIVEVLPPHIEKVGVFVDTPGGEVRGIQRSLGLNILQFHGNESPGYCLSFPGKVIKAFRIGLPRDLEMVDSYRKAAWACLLDSCTPGKLGGSGNTWDWSFLDTRVLLAERLIVAGGLNPCNVLDAITFTRPFGVDTSSGVEKSPGEKDPHLIRQFIKLARGREKDEKGS